MSISKFLISLVAFVGVWSHANESDQTESDRVVRALPVVVVTGREKLARKDFVSEGAIRFDDIVYPIEGRVKTWSITPIGPAISCEDYRDRVEDAQALWSKIEMSSARIGELAEVAATNEYERQRRHRRLSKEVARVEKYSNELNKTFGLNWSEADRRLVYSFEFAPREVLGRVWKRDWQVRSTQLKLVEVQWLDGTWIGQSIDQLVGMGALKVERGSERHSFELHRETSPMQACVEGLSIKVYGELTVDYTIQGLPGIRSRTFGVVFYSKQLR